MKAIVEVASRPTAVMRCTYMCVCHREQFVTFYYTSKYETIIMERQVEDIILAVVVDVGGMAEISLARLGVHRRPQKAYIALPEGGDPCCRSPRWKTYSR